MVASSIQGYSREEVNPQSPQLSQRDDFVCSDILREPTHPVAYLRGPLCEGPPLPRTAVIFVTILGLFLAPFRDKIAATSDQMRFWGRKML